MNHPIINRSGGRARRRRGTAAFTLVELLVVIVIIGVLAAILIPVAGSVRKNARASKCLSGIRQYAIATQLYAQDNGGKLPRTAWAAGGHYGHYDLIPYFNAPVKGGDRIKYVTCTEEGWIYGLNAFISEARAASITQPSRQILGVCSGAGWLDTASIAGTNDSLTRTPKPHSGKISVVRLSGNVSSERVSTLLYSDVRRDTRFYREADETTYFLGGNAAYDR